MDDLQYISASSHVWSQILVIKAKHELNAIEMAEIMGINRASYHRMLRVGKMPRFEYLWQLSFHFGVSMSHWFPPVGEPKILPPEAPDPEVVVVEELTAKTTPLIRDLFTALLQLPAVDKYALLDFVRGNPKLLMQAMRIMKTLIDLSEGDQEKLIKAVEALADKKREPA